MKGFTLIEILIVAVIMVFLISGIFMVLNMGEKTWNYDIGLLDLQQEARSAMDGMIRELRGSSSISIDPINGSWISFTIPTATSGIRYYISSENSIVREHPNSTNCASVWNETYCKILGNDINYLNFNLTGKILEVRLRAQKTARGRTIYYPLKDNPNNTSEIRLLSEKVKLRN